MDPPDTEAGELGSWAVEALLLSQRGPETSRRNPDVLT